MNNILEGFTILDFSHRLPGPLGMNILGHLGATVYKVEDEVFKDSFLVGPFAQFDESFVDWYEHLNDQKNLLRLPFKDEASIVKVHDLVKQADGIMMALPPKVRSFLQLTDEDLKKIKPDLAVIEMGASTKHQQSMHDINAMALTDMLSLYVQDKNEDIVNPPFLPISGMFFGQQLATELLAAILKAKKQAAFTKITSHLYDTAEMMCRPIWSEKLREKKRVKFLHNGAFPCYCLYKTKDNHYLAIAAVEEKFWLEFSKSFQIDIKDRFDTSRESFEKVAQKINALNLEEAMNIIEGKDMCVCAVKKLN